MESSSPSDTTMPYLCLITQVCFKIVHFIWCNSEKTKWKWRGNWKLRLWKMFAFNPKNVFVFMVAIYGNVRTRCWFIKYKPSTSQLREWQTMTSRLSKHCTWDNRALWLQVIGSDLPYTEDSLSLSIFIIHVSLSPTLECSLGGGVGGKLEMFLSSSQTKVQYTVLSLCIHTYIHLKSQLLMFPDI